MAPSIWTGFFVLLIVELVVLFIIRSSRPGQTKCKKRLSEVVVENAATYINYKVRSNGLISIDTVQPHLNFITLYRSKDEIVQIPPLKDTCKTGAESFLLKLRGISSNQPPGILRFYNYLMDVRYNWKNRRN